MADVPLLSHEDALQLASELRQVAYFLDAAVADGVDIPYFYKNVEFSSWLTQNDYVDDEPVVDEAATKQALGNMLTFLGSCDKEFLGDNIRLTKKFGQFVKITGRVTREVTCKKVPTGKIIHHEAYTTPARDEVEYEWDCSDEGSLLRAVNG